jgi:AraC-like DNA-binding protein
MVFSTTPTRPAVTVVDIDELPAPHTGLDTLAEDGITLQSPPLQGRRVIVRLESVMVLYQATNLRVRTRARVHDDFVACVIFGPRATGTVGGFRVRPGMLLVAEPGGEAEFVVDPGYESIALLVPPGDLPGRSAPRRKSGSRPPQDVAVLQADPLQTRRLFRQGRQVTAVAAKAPALFDYGRPARQSAEIELMDALLAAIRTASALDPAGSEKTQLVHSRIVRLAEDFTLARLGERIQVSQLCRAADVSERTLECAFKEITGLSPVAYLTRLRLHRARAALLAANPDSTHVSAEAIKCGFWHFGDFSRAYKQCFGELPSQTLRRTSGVAEDRSAAARHPHGRSA